MPQPPKEIRLVHGEAEQLSNAIAQNRNVPIKTKGNHIKKTTTQLLWKIPRRPPLLPVANAIMCHTCQLHILSPKPFSDIDNIAKMVKIMMTEAVKITQKGQVTIPKEIRERLKTNTVYFEVVNDAIMVRAVKELQGAKRQSGCKFNRYSSL